MELKRISFCDKTQWNICSNPFKKFLLEGLEEKYQYHVPNGPLDCTNVTDTMKQSQKNHIIFQLKQ